MLYRFQIELSDIDRGVYESLDFRVAMHPSETAAYLLTRTLAYCLSYRPGLEFSPKGLADPDAPALLVTGQAGSIELWIEIGNPSARKLHKASKAAREVMVFTYKNPELLRIEIAAGDVHRAAEIKIQAFKASALEQLERGLEKNNRWSVLVQDGAIGVEGPGLSVTM
jgi:uncharacterized protein YaeQ